jgi:glycosyltransferase involved in cell wall biosynthesis
MEQSLHKLTEHYTISHGITSLIKKLQDGLTSEKNAAITAAAMRRKEAFKQSVATSKNTEATTDEPGGKIRVCLITEELASAGRSGGIGAAFLELSKVLANSKHVHFELLYANPWEGTNERTKQELGEFSEKHSIKTHVLDPGLYVNPPFTPEKLSYAVLQWILSNRQLEQRPCWDIIHFHDYKGLGYFPALFNRQRPNTIAHQVIVQTHGPTRWALEANNRFWSHEQQLTIDFLERKSIEYCNLVISPSEYLLTWFGQNGWVLAGGEKGQAMVLQNPRSPWLAQARDSETRQQAGVKEIIFFGRHEERKGLPFFISAINKIRTTKNILANVKITVMGGLGEIGETPSLLYLRDATRGWSNIDLRVITDYNRSEATAYLAEKSHEKLVCICSPYENSPYTVVEAIEAGCMVIISSEGGGKELISLESNYKGVISMNTTCLAAAIEDAIHHPEAYQCQFKFTTDEIHSSWEQLHSQSKLSRFYSNSPKPQFLQAVESNNLPLVSFVITHYQRPLKLLEVLTSAILQTYPRLEIIVVDDGSNSATAEILMQKVKPLLDLCGGKLVVRENGYLGAARNTGIDHASGDYILFMDDDDIAMPNLVTRLVESTLNFPSDITVAFNTYMPVLQRDHWRASRLSNECPLPSYIPTGDIKPLTPLHNVYGACTSLIATQKLRELGGYSELRDVGHEDYELYAHLTGAGATLTVHPEVLYLYETERPSMLSRTTLWKNFARSVKAHPITDDMYDLILCIKGQEIAGMQRSRISWILKDDPAVGILDVWPQHEASIRFIKDLIKGNPEYETLNNALAD